MPDKLGRFVKGEHWRLSRPYWDRDWLAREYTEKERSATEIATQFKITENAILFWLRKHGIPRRSMSEIRSRKKWGLRGKANGMYGIRGDKNPRWKGGLASRPQGRIEYREWREAVIKRFGNQCSECGRKNLQGKELHAHHIRSWREFPAERYDHLNGVVICSTCHARVTANPRDSLGRFMSPTAL